ncbi:peptide/nickel transport system substrate-binding protein [Staphylococcus devriesei]|nr:peptide/nickel transport system substrate-binding protein [Staphylococcus devriesei]
MKILMKYLILVLVATLVLSACGKNGGGSLDKATSKTETSNHKGGEMNIALGAPPSGTFSTLLSSDASDANVEGYFNESLIKLIKI